MAYEEEDSPKNKVSAETWLFIGALVFYSLTSWLGCEDRHEPRHYHDDPYDRMEQDDDYY